MVYMAVSGRGWGVGRGQPLASALLLRPSCLVFCLALALSCPALLCLAHLNVLVSFQLFLLSPAKRRGIRGGTAAG